MCQCGMLKDEKGDHTGVPKKSVENTIHDRVRDGLARQVRRMGPTVDLERVAPQLVETIQGFRAARKRYEFARIDAVATIPGSNNSSDEHGGIGKSGRDMQPRKAKVKPISIELGGRMGP